MKITSYDSQGNVLKGTDSDGLVPDYIKSYDKNKSVLSLYAKAEFKCTKDDYFGNFLNAKKAEVMFNIDYGNYLKSPFANILAIEQIEGETIIKTPEFPEIEYEDKKLAIIINVYGSKSPEQIERALCDKMIRNLDCLSESTWILSLVNHAIKNTNRYLHRVESKDIAFKVALQSVINRYAFALKRMIKYKSTSEVEAQINVLKPFVSSNAFYVKNEDIDTYYTNKFLQKLLNSFFNFGIDRRHDSYSLYRLLRGSDNSKFTAQSNQSLYFSVVSQQAPSITHTFTIKEFNGNQTIITITDKEIESLIDPVTVGNTLNILKQTFDRIYNGYITSSYKDIWDNQINQRRLKALMPEKIQSWSYLFFDELSDYNQISLANSFKEQMCFYKLVYSFVNTLKPKAITFDGLLINCFFSLLIRNNCQDQIGFFEKIYTINEILSHADQNDIGLLNKIEHWNQIVWYKDRIEAIDDMLSFLEPILNSYYVNEGVISIETLTNIIKTILRDNRFLQIILMARPTQLLKKIKKHRNYKCNIALLLNILGGLYDYNLSTSKGTFKLLNSAPSIAYDELVKPYGIVNDTNNNRYITQFDQFGTNYSVISSVMAQTIVDVVRKAKKP